MKPDNSFAGPAQASAARKTPRKTSAAAAPKVDGTTDKVRAKHMLATDREAQIVRRAVEYFSAHGFGVSTRELAKHIGVTQPLLYHYFGSKEKLVERVYREVFFSRWNPEWEELLKDSTRPLDERLIAYLEDYTHAILGNDWIRLFVFAALDDPSLNKRYIGLLQERIFKPVLRELRASKGMPPEPTEIDLELFWGFHSSFFYMGVRRWIYRMEVPDDLTRLIEAHVHNFLFGFYATLAAGLTSAQGEA
ncbi:TetR family transcriptional regulator [Caballeronia choica]|uniref:TetR family transcriptional regulator n=2 Tax=Caballeronia choica TaxID=326476 RepID=A0A158FPG5_9BURK|nr:TetR family transcriptional regulator [Caballeronia choica]